MNAKEADALFKEWLYSKHPDAFKKFKLAVYKKGEKPEESEDEVDINAPYIQNLAESFYKAFFLVPNPKRSTLLYNIVRQFAKSFKDEEKIQKLNVLYNSCGGTGFPLAIVEKVVFKDLYTAPVVNLTKNYNTGWRTRSLKLGDLIVAQNNADVELYDIFNEICSQNDLPFKMPNFDASATDVMRPL